MAKKKKSRDPFHKIPQFRRPYVNELEGRLDAVYAEADRQGWSDRELAARAGLSPRTVYAHRNRKVKNPNDTTVWKLLRAINLRYKLSPIQKARETKKRLSSKRATVKR